MKQLLIFLFISLNISVMAQKEAKIIYVGDPMCSWCYGIAPEFSKLEDAYKGKFEFELVMGGLRPYNEQKMIELKDFLTTHWHEVHERSGQEFNYGILDSNQISYDTEPPSRATIVVRQLNPENEISFFKEVQKLFYKENKNMHLTESYYPLLDQFGIDQNEFKKLFESKEFKEKIKLDFTRATELGVNSFPTILIEYQGNVSAIARGYSTSEKMIRRVEEIMN